MHPILVLAIATAIVLVCILRWKINAFAALLLAAIAVGLLAGKMPASRVMLEVSGAFGDIVGRIGIVIVMAAVIGQCLMDSGAADKITRRFLAVLGRKYASVSLLVTGFVLSIPVFADTVFFLLIPLARVMSLRMEGRNYLLFVLAISAGASSTHVFVPPTPGPLAAAANLRLDLGVAMMAGLVVAIPASFVSWLFAIWADRRWPIEVRSAPGADLERLKKDVDLPEEKLPGFWISLAPIGLPVLLISAAVAADTWAKGSALAGFMAFIGNANLALMIAAAIALGVLMKQKQASLASLAAPLERAIASGGVVMLITAAGGSFGAMLQKSGLGDELGKVSAALGISAILLAYLLAALFKFAQGSGTVAMIASSAIMLPLITAAPPDCHPLYVFLAIASGSQMGLWMNDSGFWAFSSMAGLTEIETLRTRSVMMAVLSVTGLAFTLLGSWLLPLR